MKHLVRLYIVLFLFVSDFKLFAQPGEDDGTGGMDDEDDPVPINGKLVWLAIVGLAFAFYIFKKHKRATIQS